MIGADAAKDLEEDILTDVVGLGGVTQSLQREAIDTIPVEGMEAVECLRRALDDLLDQHSILATLGGLRGFVGG